ncbi:hypothetical protein [Streptomyces coeruleorubidus]|uniref:hypothetical protein n=1 Tax=Streptomyces coeruleorubidus TaxID=116188 RepID=UPI0033AB35F4
MSLIDHIPGLKGAGSHRAADRIAELERLVDQLRDENVKLLNRQAAADDFFMIQDQYATDLEAELAQEKRAHAATRADLEVHNRWVADLEGRLADAERRLDISKLAETAVERTQEMPAITPVVPLHQSPQARSAPSWAKTVEAEPEVEPDEHDPDYAPNPPYDLPEGDWK